MTESDTWLMAFFHGATELPTVQDSDAWFLDLRHHGIIPLVVEGAARRELDLPFAERCQDQAMQEAVHEHELRRELANLDAALDDAGIDAVVFKGSALSLTHYPAPGLRPRSDTDVLVAPEDFAKTSALLEGQGFSALPVAGQLVTATRTYVRSSRFERTAMVDLHHRISSLPHPLADTLTMARCLAAGNRLPGYRRLFVPDDEDALLLAVFHRAQHFSHEGERLIWLYDIRLLAATLAPSAWQALAARAVKLGLASAMLHASAALETWFGEGLPLPKMAPDASRHFFSDDLDTGVANRLWLAVGSLPGWRSRFRFAWQKLFPPADLLRYAHPGEPLVLLYLQRILRAVKLLMLSVRGPAESKRANSA